MEWTKYNLKGILFRIGLIIISILICIFDLVVGLFGLFIIFIYTLFEVILWLKK